MNARCKAKKKSGERCRAAAVESGLCRLHAHPEQAAELGRKSGRSRRGSGDFERMSSELTLPTTAQQVRDLLAQVMCDVCARRLPPKIASTIGYIASVLLKSIQFSDTEVRLAALEALIKNTAVQN
jgi:hypothetical protein